MRSIASLCQMNRYAPVSALREQQAAIFDAIDELERAAELIELIVNERQEACEYAADAAFTATCEAREVLGIVSYADIRGH